MRKHFKYEGESVNRPQLDIKRKTCDICSSTYRPLTLVHLPHRFTIASKHAAQKSLAVGLSHFRNSVATSSSSAKHLTPMCFFGWPNRWRSLGATSGL
jgi:hypothetical protein